jgi:hypothetical protein
LAGPSIALSGSLKSAADAGGALIEPDYELFVTSEEPNYGARNIEITVDGELYDFVDGSCTGGGCQLERDWTFPNADFPAGQHVIRVTVRDGAGRARSRDLSVVTDPPDRDENGPEDDVGGAAGGDVDPAQDAALEPEARSRWPETFAGLWQVAEGRVLIAFTANANENVDALRQQFPQAPALVPVTLPRSLAELEALQDRMIADRDGLRPAGVVPLPEHYDLGIDVIQKTAYAVVEAPDPSAVLAFTSRYGPVQVRPGPLAEPARCTRRNCKPTLRAGLAVDDAAGRCSSAFVARGPNGNLNLLSAAHCGDNDVGGARYHGGERYGEVVGQQQARRVDAERHSIEAPFTGDQIILVDGSRRARPVTEVSGSWEETRVGRRVCKTGQRTGFTCGKIIDKHVSMDYVPDSGRFIAFKACVKRGDSGGAVFRDQRAYGIVSGATTSVRCKNPDHYSVFGHIEYVRNALNVTNIKGG